MPRRTPHTKADIDALGARLRASWPGAGIEMWLEQHHSEIRRLTRGSHCWTYDDLASALNSAGITYAAGVPLAGGGVSRGKWTGRQLGNKVRAITQRVAAREAEALMPERVQGVADIIEEILVRRGVLPPGSGTGSQITSQPGRSPTLRQRMVQGDLLATAPSVDRRQDHLPSPGATVASPQQSGPSEVPVYGIIAPPLREPPGSIESAVDARKAKLREVLARGENKGK